MRTETLSNELIFALLKLLSKALVAQPRQERSARLLVYKEDKIYQAIDSLFNKINTFNYFDQRIFPGRHVLDDISFSEVPLDATLSPETALEIDHIFLTALSHKLCLNSDAKKLLADEKLIYKVVDKLFEMSPAFNLFEYRQFINRAPFEHFEEVKDCNGKDFIVCKADEVCLPWGHKNGERIPIPNSFCDHMTVIGVAPFLYESELALWGAIDSHQYMDPTKPTVSAWRTPGTI